MCIAANLVCYHDLLGGLLRDQLRWRRIAFEALSEGLAEELHPNWNIKVSCSYMTITCIPLRTDCCGSLQVTILEPGPFRTKCPTDNAITDPIHPAYTDPSLPTMRWRGIFGSPGRVFNGDPDKFAEAVYRVAYLEDPPLRLPIHPVSLAVLRRKGKQLLETADKWESWSEDVLMKD